MVRHLRFRWRAKTRRTLGWTRAAMLESGGVSQMHPERAQAQHFLNRPEQDCSAVENCGLIVLLVRTL